MADKDKHESFDDSKVGIGQNDDGSFNSFPASDLPAKLAERASDEEATDHAVEQSEQGFPDEVDPADMDDLDDLDELMGPADGKQAS